MSFEYCDNKLVNEANRNTDPIEPSFCVDQEAAEDISKGKETCDSIIYSTFIADGIIKRYDNVINRLTPRVGTSFCSDNKPARNSLQIEKSQIQFGFSVPTSSNLKSDNRTTGLDKYKRYMEARARPKIATNMQNFETRSIVGQEDNSDEGFTNSRSASSTNKDRKLLSRPPAVGQASSSSDSGSFILDHHSPTPESDINSSDEYPPKHNPGVVESTSNGRSNQQQLGVLSNRDDFISERPPEGSSEQDSAASPPDLQTELPRIPSPSSASSVASASVRPLEWDSGADVGYYQLYTSSNPVVDDKLSTIERIALARGSAALLTRSDPEGTTEHTSQIAGKTLSIKPVKRKIYVKDHIGVPIAESTPFSTDIVNTPKVTEGSLSENEDLSVIAEPKLNLPDNNKCKQPSINCDNRDLPCLQNPSGAYPLFPELIVKENQSSNTDFNNKEVIACSKVPKHQIGSLKSSNKAYDEQEHVELHSLQKHLSSGTGCNEVLSSEKENIVYLDSGCPQSVRILSSSMEILNIKPIGSKKERATLPRSYSHSNVTNEINNVNSLPKSVMLRSFVPTKSASSSSVSTIVQKKRDSPKRTSKLVQTSLVQQSVGTQVTGPECPFILTSSAVISASGTSSSSNVPPDIGNERSSYFSCVGSGDFVSERQMCNYGKGKVHQSKTFQNNFQCSGAHKKFSKNNCTSYERESSAGSEQQIIQNEVGPLQECPNRINIHTSNDFQNIIKNWNTLESVESSARSGQNTWTDQRESLVAEDRVNSFEYLPGHMYENAAIQENDSHDTGTSSVSLNQIGSSQNDYSDESDKLWDASASSTLIRDIERGVNLMSEFVKTSNVSDSRMKEKLLKKVVEKLLKTDYPEDRLWSREHFQGQWVSSQDPNIPDVYNGRETRRSHNKSISTSNKSSDRNFDSFHQKNSSNDDHIRLRETIEKCVGTDQSRVSAELCSESKRLSVQSSSSDLVTESGGSSAKPKSTADESADHPFKSNTRFASSNLSRSKKKQYSNNFSETVISSSNSNIVTDRSQSVDSSSERTPVLTGKKLSDENKIKQDVKNLKETRIGDSEFLLEYLKIERQNQLFWIKSEIDHLSNLKRLLERQEELKKSLTKLGKSRTRTILSNKKTKYSSFKGNSPCKHEKAKKSEICTDGHDEKTSQLSSDWSSHHYSIEKKSSNVSNIKDKRSEKVYPRENKPNKLTTSNSSSKKIEQNKYPISDVIRVEEDDILSNEDDDSVCVHMRRTVGTETTDSVAVQTSKSVHQLPVIKPKWYRNQNCSKKTTKCSCKRNSSCRCEKKKIVEDDKKSVAYFITFDDKLRRNNEFTGNDVNEKIHISRQNLCHVKRSCFDSGQISSDTNECNRFSDQKENREPSSRMIANQQLPTLQDYLLRNRADYVTRAEFRRRCVAELAYLRELRDKSKRHLITLAPSSSDNSQSTTPRNLPPPPLAVKRVFSQKSMRRQTERKYRQLAEVQSRQLDLKRKEAYRTNRLMAEVFTKKLQRKTLKGEVNLSNSVSVISGTL